MTEIGVLVLVLAMPTLAAAPRTDPAIGYMVRNWQLAEGLPQISVQALAQTPDGYLWLGTQIGLARFDGIRFTVPSEPDALALKGANIWALHVDHAGTLWIGTYRGELLRLTDGAFSRVDVPIRSAVSGFYEDAFQALWVATYGDGLIRLSEGRSTQYRVADGLPSDVVTALAGEFDGTVWIATDKGLARWVDGRLTAEPSPTVANSNRIGSLAVDAEGTLWMGTTAGLYRRTAGQWELVDGAPVPLSQTGSVPPAGDTMTAPWRQVMALQIMDSGELLIGAFGGVARSHGRPSATAAYVTLLSTGSSTTSVLEDREGNVWVGTTTRGLYRVTARSVNMIGVEHGLSQEAIRRVFEDSLGRVWIGTEDGLNRLTPEGITQYPLGRSGSHNAILEISEDQDGLVWVQASTGAYRLRDDEFVPIVVEGGSANALITRHYRDPQGRQWFGTSGGLTKIEAGRTTRYTTSEGLNDNQIRAIEPGSPDLLWIGTRKGLNRLSLSRDKLTREPAVPDAIISTLEQGFDGSLWIGTHGAGLMRLRDEVLTTLGSAQGLPSDNICQTLEDEVGNLWLSTNQGIVRVSRDDFEQLAEMPMQMIPVKVFDEADGMASRECGGKVRPSGGRFRDGNLWFATIRGVAVIDPRKLQHNDRPPTVVVEQLLVDQTAQPLTDGNELSQGSRSIELHYTATSLTAAEKNHFKVQLEGFDEDWVDAGHRRVAYYSSLPAGHYRFRVTASNNDGVWNESGASLAFSVRAPFHRTSTFYALIGIAVGLLLVLAHRYRTLRLRARNAVLVERNRIAREIHDTLAQGLIGIKVQVEVAKQLIERAPVQARIHLEKAQALAEASVDEAHQSVWALRDTALGDGDLAAAVSRVVEALTLHTALEVRVEVEGELPLLDAERFFQILRLVREAVANVVRHAHARTLTVAMVSHPTTLRISVHDDGCGFDPRPLSSPHDFGLTGMRERAERIGAKLVLNSKAGCGTQIELALPLPLRQNTP